MSVEIRTIYKGENEIALTTKVEAISDSSGNSLSSILNSKQDNLESGINIKTVGGESILGEGNIVVSKYETVFMTSAEYEALAEKDPETIYFIYEDEDPAETVWKFGDTFPIYFGSRSTTEWVFGSAFPIQF